MKQDQRISLKQKEANQKEWYRNKADELDRNYNRHSEDKRRMKINYDLFNNILDMSDFQYVCKPLGSGDYVLPANMVNRDICSSKINHLLGSEMKKPFSWKVIATNHEATTRREQEEFSRVRDYVVEQIMQPLQQQMQQEQQMQMQQQMQSPEQGQMPPEMQQMMQQGQPSEAPQQEVPQQEVTQAQTPQEVRKYMLREHQDPAEVASHQILEYLIQKLDVSKKFNTLFKHGLLSAKEIMYVGAFHGEPYLWVVNPLRFDYDKSPDLDKIEDGEYATCEYLMSPSDIVKYFGKELNKEQTLRIYEECKSYQGDLFTADNYFFQSEKSTTISAVHCTWKSLRKVGFLTYLDEQGLEQMMMVDETYKISKDTGDIKIEWEWIPEVYETWKIKTSDPIYLNMRPLPGQFKDLDNMYHCKLPYYGSVHDSLNSEPTSLMDRLKVYQYYYNILWYKFELLSASDKGKKVLMDISTVPKTDNINLETWMQYLETSPIMWYNSATEGNFSTPDANSIAKVIDLSYAGQMNQYIQMMEYVAQRCARSVGITEQNEFKSGFNQSDVTGQPEPDTNLLEPYYNLHDNLKARVLMALIETAKVVYSQNPPKSLTYVLDDLSYRTITEEQFGLLDNNTIGLYVANSMKIEEAMNMVKQLSHAAMQNQRVELSDVISLLRKDSIVEAEESLKVAEQNKQEQMQQMQQQQQQADQQLEQMRLQADKEKQQFELVKLNAEFDRKEKLETLKSAMLASSFNPDTDRNSDGVNDYIQIAKGGLDVDLKASKQQLEKDKFEHKKKMDQLKLDNNKG